MDLAFTDLQDELRTQARGYLESTPEPTWAALAELGWTGAGVAEEHGGAGLSFLEEAVIHEEAGRALLHAPLWSTSTLLPFLPAEDQAAVAAGTASWTLALGPLVPDLDTATNVAVPGGDTVWELVGYERAEELFLFVLLTLVVPLGLLVPRRTRRFGRYMLFGVVATAVVVVGVAVGVLYYLINRDR